MTFVERSLDTMCGPCPDGRVEAGRLDPGYCGVMVQVKRKGLEYRIGEEGR